MLECMHGDPGAIMKTRNKLSSLTFLAVAALALPLASAQDLRAGLWEFTLAVGAGGPMTQKQFAAAMRKTVAAMPAQMRKEYEAEAARAQTRITDTHVSSKACVTPAQVANRQWLFPQPGKCTNLTSPKVRGTMTFAYSCTDPHSSGQGRVTFKGTTGFTEVMRGSSRLVMGDRSHDMAFSNRTSGRWLGANCGAIRPREMPATE
jgi:hypothetical protein